MTTCLTGRSGRSMLLAASLFAAAIAGSGPAAAQTPAAPASPAAPTAQPDRRATARVEARITEMHTKLHITAAEQPQWDAFAAVMREQAAHTDAAIDARRETKAASALQQMRDYTDMASNHAADMQKMLTAFETLYNSMPPDQQKVADAVFSAREMQRRR